ncbi:Uncharacterized protein FKW44_002152 [Caligus rogercresseyi]|uniref:Uncharacterized protein n=1 Tax=Caligus rogercresseyi TaxID=217165 RepID=A0A7T8KK49_CALRO|nr:Uncharacterized protein FKW44_002152 [Caligus rogercresseyi]
MDTKRQRVSDLLCAQVSVAEIVKMVGVSKTIVYDTKKKLEAGDSLERKPGCCGHNKILTDEFLVCLFAEIEEDASILVP